MQSPRKVRPGGEDALGEDRRIVVQGLVERREGWSGEADFIDVREGQTDTHTNAVPGFRNAVPLSAGIPGGATGVTQDTMGHGGHEASIHYSTRPAYRRLTGNARERDALQSPATPAMCRT